jgi:hypothetical protein
MLAVPIPNVDAEHQIDIGILGITSGSTRLVRPDVVGVVGFVAAAAAVWIIYGNKG